MTLETIKKRRSKIRKWVKSGCDDDEVLAEKLDNAGFIRSDGDRITSINAAYYRRDAGIKLKIYPKKNGRGNGKTKEIKHPDLHLPQIILNSHILTDEKKIKMLDVYFH